MTQEPPPTEVDPIEVKGQRRVPGGAFPGPPTTGGGGGEEQEELDPDGQPSGGSHPCDDPETAREWNADAAAAEALRRMIEKALAQNDPTHNLSNREYGAMICEAADGSLFVSDIVWGDPIFDAAGNWVGAGQQPTVDVRIDACGAGNRPLAMVHSHPGVGASGGTPSRPDASWVAAINAARGDNAGRIYVISTGNATNPYEIRVYDESNVEEGSEDGEAGPEVNPDGTPCLGVVIG